MTKITLQNWPRAIMHLDADAFFASVEQALDPKLKGLPVVTGAERGIVSAASYEAKALGIQRGTPIFEIKKRYPQVIIKEGDYESYGLFSKKMFEIMRRHSPDVEEYSIDEAFADLTGLRRLHRGNYKSIAVKVQKEILSELGIGVSIGISLSKSLAKLASKAQKPSGIVTVAGKEIESFLKDIAIEKVWGIGPNTSALLRKYGVRTALDFAVRPVEFAESVIGKIGVEIRAELRGENIYKLVTSEKDHFLSISKGHTFAPPSSSADFVFAQAVRNLEGACEKARRHNLAAKCVSLRLKSQTFQSAIAETKLAVPSASPLEIVPHLKRLFAEVFRGGIVYRATEVTLFHLIDANNIQLSLFEDPANLERSEKASQAVDEINNRFGRRSVQIATGLYLHEDLSKAQKSIGLPMMTIS